VVSSFSSTSASVLVPTLGVEDEEEEEEEDTSSVRGREREGEGSDGRVNFPALWAITSSGKKTENGWAGWREICRFQTWSQHMSDAFQRSHIRK
jgi:hypothetical protein